MKCPGCGVDRKSIDTSCGICGHIGASIAQIDSQQTKKCPYCSESILAEAKKCKHCGEMLDSSLRKSAPPQVKVVAKEGCFLQTLNIGCAIVIFVIIAVICLVVFAAHS